MKSGCCDSAANAFRHGDPIRLCCSHMCIASDGGAILLWIMFGTIRGTMLLERNMAPYGGEGAYIKIHLLYFVRCDAV